MLLTCIGVWSCVPSGTASISMQLTGCQTSFQLSVTTHRVLKHALRVEPAVPVPTDRAVEVFGDIRREVSKVQQRGEPVKSVLLEELGIL